MYVGFSSIDVIVDGCASSNMNGFVEYGLDEDAFGEKNAGGIVQAFDAFREFKCVQVERDMLDSIFALVTS